MSPQVREKLEKISDQTDESLSQVVRRAVALYEMLISETSAGGEIVIRTNDGSEKHVVLI